MLFTLLLIKYDAEELDGSFCCFVFDAFANAGMDAASPSLIVFAIGSDLVTFALPNVVGDDVVGVEVSPFVGEEEGAGSSPAEGAFVSQSGRKHASVAMHNHCPPAHSHSRELNVSPQHSSSPLAHRAPSSEHLPPGKHSEEVGETVGRSVAATGDGVGFVVGEEVGGSVDATGASVGLFVGEVVGESVAATGDGVGLVVGEEVGGSVGATGASVGLFVGEVVGGSVAATGALVGNGVGMFVGESVGGAAVQNAGLASV